MVSEYGQSVQCLFPLSYDVVVNVCNEMEIMALFSYRDDFFDGQSFKSSMNAGIYSGF